MQGVANRAAAHLSRGVAPGRQTHPSRKGGQAESPAPPSWWTARATTGAVEPGFTKAEILKPAAEDPRSEHGVFTLVGGLLSDLLG